MSYDDWLGGGFGDCQEGPDCPNCYKEMHLDADDDWVCDCGGLIDCSREPEDPRYDADGDCYDYEPTNGEG
jgi:hypothetical protein